MNEIAQDRVVSCRIVDEELCTSDHNAVVTRLKLLPINHSSEVIEPEKELKFHRFPWKNSIFVELYNHKIIELSGKLLEYLNNNYMPGKALIDHVYIELKKTCLYAARSCEKELGLVTSNGVRKNFRYIYNEKIIQVLSELRRTKHENSTSFLIYKSSLRKQLRSLQRTEIFDNSKCSALKLENMLRFDKPAFWRKVTAFRANSRKRVRISTKQPSAKDFIDYYSDLFSHHDRAPNAQHVLIESEVKSTYLEIKEENFNFNFRNVDIADWVAKLKSNKASGNDSLSNEMLKFGACPALFEVLRVFYSYILNVGYVPPLFNCAVIKPIPKKGKINEPSDYRPISISSVLSSLFEFLLLSKIEKIKDTTNNQFGYKKFTSCKSTYYVVNETFEFYKHGGSNLHMVSLDAVKAFDKLWRSGLFFKLKGVIEPGAWRALYVYYLSSSAVVSVNGFRSGVFKTTEGVKQGGILSPFLFNFFLDSLIKENNQLEIGALLGKCNVSTVAYCDDIALLSPSEGHMQTLLDNCARFAIDWKLQFNPTKSVCYSSNPKVFPAFKMSELLVPVTQGFLYLGLPVGNQDYIEEFFDEKMRRVEKSFFSLRGLGCKPAALHPRKIAFIFKQYCQSIVKFGLENIYLSPAKIKQLNIRQNMIVKIGLGLSTYCRTKPLFRALRIEHFEQLYLKHKIFFLKQIMKNTFTREIFSFLKTFYKDLLLPKLCFNYQLDQVKLTTKVEPSISNCGSQLKWLDENFLSGDDGMYNEVVEILNTYDIQRFFITTKNLSELLYVDFRINR